ncbi:MAG TPA: PA0069 family radical SAM protein [Thermoanaerobaculia bacterium]
MGHITIQGRGAASNPKNRFHEIAVERDDWVEAEDPAPRTRFYRDPTRTIIARNESPDVGFEASVNPYRGCAHGCVYCFARPFHEYLDLSPGLDFETKIFVKEDAAELLRKELSAQSWEPKFILMSGVTDPYQHVERKLKITRRCLEVLAEFRNPVGVITKSDLVTRDVDVLADLARHDCASATLSITTLSKDLKRVMEPRAALPEKRLEAIRRLSEAGVPTGVNVAPVIPGLTDHEMPEILERAAEAGAIRAAWIMLRLPHAVKDLFADWLERHFPERKEKVLNRLRDLRGGVLYDSRYGARMRGEGPFAEQVRQVFEVSCRRFGLNQVPVELTTAGFRRPSHGPQLRLFDAETGAR